MKFMKSDWNSKLTVDFIRRLKNFHYTVRMEKKFLMLCSACFLMMKKELKHVIIYKQILLKNWFFIIHFKAERLSSNYVSLYY